MRAIGILVMVTLFAWTTADPQEAPPQRFQSQSSDLVVLPVTVLNKQRQFLTAIPAERFAVYDNGRRQQIALFSSEDTPVSLALVLDDSGSMRGKLADVVAASLAFARSSNPADEIVVIEFNDSVRYALGGRRIAASDIPDLEAALRTLVPQGRTALYSALIDGLDHLEKSRLSRKALVLLSDGGDNASRATLDQVLSRARASSVTIYAIGFFDKDDPDRNDRVLKRLAGETGGEMLAPSSAGPLISACQRVARAIRTGYTIAFVPPERDGAYHRIRVEIDGSEGHRFIVRTREGYLAATGDPE
jgi:Ca-activated chloride channel family protein